MYRSNIETIVTIGSCVLWQAVWIHSCCKRLCGSLQGEGRGGEGRGEGRGGGRGIGNCAEEQVRVFTGAI